MIGGRQTVEAYGDLLKVVLDAGATEARIRALAESERTADDRVTAAEAEAGRMVNDARSEASGLVASAKSEAAGIVRAAVLKRDTALDGFEGREKALSEREVAVADMERSAEAALKAAKGRHAEAEKAMARAVGLESRLDKALADIEDKKVSARAALSALA